MKRNFSILFLLCGTIFLVCAADGSWLAKVPAKERLKMNPYHSQPDAVAAGEKSFPRPLCFLP